MAIKKQGNELGYKLVVRSPFNHYQRGDEILDVTEIKAILESPASLSVIKVSTSTEE